MHNLQELVKNNDLVISLAAQLSVTNSSLKSLMVSNPTRTKKETFLAAVTHLVMNSEPKEIHSINNEDIQKASELITELLKSIVE